jgi:hypothetical protein
MKDAVSKIQDLFSVVDYDELLIVLGHDNTALCFRNKKEIVKYKIINNKHINFDLKNVVDKSNIIDIKILLNTKNILIDHLETDFYDTIDYLPFDYIFDKKSIYNSICGEVKLDKKNAWYINLYHCKPNKFMNKFLYTLLETFNIKDFNINFLHIELFNAFLRYSNHLSSTEKINTFIINIFDSVLDGVNIYFSYQDVLIGHKTILNSEYENQEYLVGLIEWSIQELINSKKNIFNYEGKEILIINHLKDKIFQEYFNNFQFGLSKDLNKSRVVKAKTLHITNHKIYSDVESFNSSIFSYIFHESEFSLNHSEDFSKLSLWINLNQKYTTFIKNLGIIIMSINIIFGFGILQIKQQIKKTKENTIITIDSFNKIKNSNIINIQDLKISNFKDFEISMFSNNISFHELIKKIIFNHTIKINEINFNYVEEGIYKNKYIFNVKFFEKINFINRINKDIFIFYDEILAKQFPYYNITTTQLISNQNERNLCSKCILFQSNIRNYYD